MHGEAAFHTRHHLVLDADIGEGAAHHHFVVAAPRSVGIEVELLNPASHQIYAGGRSRPDVAGGRNVVSGDRIEEEAENAGTVNVGNERGRHGETVEIGRVRHIGALRVP